MMLFTRSTSSAARRFSSAAANGHWLASVPMGPADPILGLTDRFNKVRCVRYAFITANRLWLMMALVSL